MSDGCTDAMRRRERRKELAARIRRALKATIAHDPPCSREAKCLDCDVKWLLLAVQTANQRLLRRGS